MANWASTRLDVRGDPEEIARLRTVEDVHLRKLNVHCDPFALPDFHLKEEDKDGVAAMAGVGHIGYGGDAPHGPHTDHLIELSRLFPRLTFDLRSGDLNMAFELRIVVANGEVLWGYELDHTVLIPEFDPKREERRSMSVEEMVAELERMLAKPED